MRPLILLLVVFAVGLIGFGLFMNNQPAPAPTVQQGQFVVVALKDIPTGTLISQEALGFGPVPADEVPGQLFDRPHGRDDADQQVEDQKTFGEIIGAVARRHVSPGEALVRGQVVKPGDSGFLSAVLSPGSRAITIAVNAVSGTGGLIYPGDRVDVILTQTFPGNEAMPLHRSVSETIAHNVRVLAIDQQLQGKASPSGEQKLAQTATLEVDPHNAELIAVAGKLGDLSLVIRSIDDGAPTQPVGAVWADDVSKALKQHAAEIPRDQDKSAMATQITLIHGDKVEVVTHDR